ncbi:hypothetical protein ACEPAI_7749 [Sanghuangporus weigelae]
MSQAQPEVLSVAICLFDRVTALDYQGPIELFGRLDPDNARANSLQPPRFLRLVFLSHSLDPITPDIGPSVLPQRTYSDAIDSKVQYDILLVPGGPGARPEAVPADLTRFLETQIPGARYVLSVCTGSWILAGTGILDGRQATTNKSAFRSCKEATSKQIEWVAKARWVVDGKIWTSSGVTAGMDMANAFLAHLVGEDVVQIIRGIIELSGRASDDDEFAAVHGLLGDC